MSFWYLWTLYSFHFKETSKAYVLDAIDLFSNSNCKSNCNSNMHCKDQPTQGSICLAICRPLNSLLNLQRIKHQRYRIKGRSTIFPYQGLIHGLFCIKNLYNTGIVLPWGKWWSRIRRQANEGWSVLCLEWVIATLSSVLHAVHK